MTFTLRGWHGPLLRKCPGWTSSPLAAHLSHAGPWAEALPTRLPGKSHWLLPPMRLNQWGAPLGPPLGCLCLAPLRLQLCRAHRHWPAGYAAGRSSAGLP